MKIPHFTNPTASFALATVCALGMFALLAEPAIAADPQPGAASTQLKIETVYMTKGCCGPVVTGSVAVLEPQCSPLYIVEQAEIKGGKVKITYDDREGNREIPIPRELARLFDGLKPGPYATLMPWSELSPVDPKEGWYWPTALDDGKLCLVLPGQPKEFSIPGEKGQILHITPFPEKGVLAAVSERIQSKDEGATVLDGKYSLEGIDAATHKILWSFPVKNPALDIGRLSWISSRYLLWTCFARHWAAFEVYDLKRRKAVAQGNCNDRDEGKPFVLNWRIEGKKVLEYYWDAGEPTVVFDSGR